MARRLVFDLESDGLIPKMTRIHSLCLKDADTGELWSCHDHVTEPSFTIDVETGIKMLQEADQIIGHNVIGFDIPAIQKIYPWFSPDEDKVFDTLVAARLIWPNIADTDYARIRRGKTTLPMGLAGLHKLDAWGHRVGLWKGDYAKTRVEELKKQHDREGLAPPTEEEELEYTWGSWNQDLQDYCDQDVEVSDKLFKLIQTKQGWDKALTLEHQVAWIIAEQTRNGFGFNTEKAEELVYTLMTEKAVLEDKLRDLFKPWFAPDGPVKSWKKDMRMKTGEIRVAGARRQPIKLMVFNPGSRDQIADRLVKVYGWEPKEFTPSGQPKVDETVLENLEWPEAQKLAKYFQVKKILGQLSDGNRAWLKYAKEDRIHGSVNTNGAVTGRATHSHPNLAQVPSPKAYRGAECRELFGPLDPEHVQIGCDVSGLELRMLGHFMAAHDGGAYAREVVEGDVHWANVQALGIVSPGTLRTDSPDMDLVSYVRHSVYRNGTKTFIYAFLYGAGGEKIGLIVYEMAQAEEAKAAETEGMEPTIREAFFKKGRGKPSPEELKRVGNRLKRNFLEKTPALKKLIKGVTMAAEKNGFLKGLDGRKLHVRSPHAALNTLLQSAGALVCKQWLVEFHRLLREHGLTDKVKQMAWVHDEAQLSVHKDLIREDGTSIVGELCIQAIKAAGEFFNIRVPLDGEYIIGKNWKDCH